MHNEDIVTSLKKEVDQRESSDDEDLPPPLIAQARSAMNTLMRFVDSRGSADDVKSSLHLANSLQHKAFNLKTIFYFKVF